MFSDVCKKYSWSVRTSDITNEKLRKDKFHSVSMSKKKRLSVTSLLECAEVQAENISNLFPRIDNERYHANVMVNDSFSDSHDSIEDIGSYINDILTHESITKQQNENGEDPDRISNMKRDSSNSRKLDRLQRHCSEQRLRNTLRKMSMPVVITGFTNSPPDATWNVRQNSLSPCVWFAATIEYMVFSNKLKVSIQRHGFLLAEIGRPKRANLFAKVFLLPGNYKKQKVAVTSNMDVPSMVQPSVYIKGFSGRQLVRMQLCVKIYLKQGMFKRPVVIHEWSLSMEDIDLIDTQTAWKKIEWLPFN